LIGFDPKISLLADGKFLAIKMTVLFDKRLIKKTANAANKVF
jgi:hypothetical protein